MQWPILRLYLFVAPFVVPPFRAFRVLLRVLLVGMFYVKWSRWPDLWLGGWHDLFLGVQQEVWHGLWHEQLLSEKWVTGPIGQQGGEWLL